MFFREEKLYRIEMIEDTLYFDEKSLLATRFFSPLEQQHKAIIKKGITGEVIKKWGRKYFSPDVDQEGIELFTPTDQPYILIPYKVIENHYKIVS